MRISNALNNVLLEVKECFCFCCHCIDVASKDCVSKGYVEPWRLVTLEPCHLGYAFCDVECDETDWGIGVDNNEQATCLRVGDNFVIVVALGNNEGVDFFILQCIKEMHIVQENVGLDDWGNFVEKGDEIIIGHYYKQLGTRKSSYVLISDKSLAFIYSHLVCNSKFSLLQAVHKQKGGSTSYSLPSITLEQIKFILEEDGLQILAMNKA
jgi:hypothetical protein